jgi:hypothetical protein
MADKISPLRPSNVSPVLVIQELIKDSGEIKEMFVVTYDDAGSPKVYLSGDLKNMVYASFVLDKTADDIACGGNGTF